MNKVLLHIDCVIVMWMTGFHVISLFYLEEEEEEEEEEVVEEEEVEEVISWENINENKHFGEKKLTFILLLLHSSDDPFSFTIKNVFR